MSIVVINPGDAIVAADIESSWQSVADVINAQTPTTLRRDAFNRSQLPQLLAAHPGTNRGREYTQTNTPVTVDHVFTSTSSADIRAHWQNVLTLDGTPASTGYSLGPCWGLIMASVQAGDCDDMDEQNAALMAVTIEVNGGSATKVHPSDWRFVQNESSTFSGLHGNGILDEGAHLWTVWENTGFNTLTRIKLWCACTEITNTWSMARASLSFYAFHKG